MPQLVVDKGVTTGQFPPWLKKRLVLSKRAVKTEGLLARFKLNTVCQSASCPNRSECFSMGKATFLILGDLCTRNCTFCGVQKGIPVLPSQDEAQRIAHAVQELGLDHVIITSVTRDDLEDGGALHFSNVVRAIKACRDDVSIEVLVPDFKGSKDSVETVLKSQIEIFSHNLETVQRLYKTVRPGAHYATSLKILSMAAKKIDKVKSGFMLGLGETKEEVLNIINDLRKAGCSLLTIGQYLSPTKKHQQVQRFIAPSDFAFYRNEALRMGFNAVLSEPFARTSYMKY